MIVARIEVSRAEQVKEAKGESVSVRVYTKVTVTLCRRRRRRSALLCSRSLPPFFSLSLSHFVSFLFHQTDSRVSICDFMRARARVRRFTSARGGGCPVTNSMIAFLARPRPLCSLDLWRALFYLILMTLDALSA